MLERSPGFTMPNIRLFAFVSALAVPLAAHAGSVAERIVQIRNAPNLRSAIKLAVAMPELQAKAMITQTGVYLAARNQRIPFHEARRDLTNQGRDQPLKVNHTLYFLAEKHNSVRLDVNDEVLTEGLLASEVQPVPRRFNIEVYREGAEGDRIDQVEREI